ncbi:MAG: IPT/TIG domain-containing protein [Planctomycetes bacterium]|nr:IPT/TIG domain-containing protein [Planctomycetota bacterium]MBI3847637.1 IPT/TIG domain-containing protein [Planctomycetota bacterium]
MKRRCWLFLVFAFAVPAAAQDLIVNGSFESPTVAPGTVQYLTTIPGWQAEPGPPIEIQNNCCGAAYAGNQLVELDSNSRTATGAMYQDIPTQSGRSYTLRFGYSARPGVADNRIQVWWDGGLVTTLDRNATGQTTTQWSAQSFTVVATQTTTRVRFADVSAMDTVGGYIDGVSVVARGIQLATIVPTSGYDFGGDLVHLTGTGFTSVADTTVTFGGTPATVVSVSSTAIDVLTPAGLGVVDVVVTNTIGSATLTSAYTYAPPELAARFGNVNVGAGDREDVLLVNAVPGDANREVVLTTGQPFTITMGSPSSRASARFAIYVWNGASSAATLRGQPANLGVAVFPTPLNFGDAPQPRQIGNNFDLRLGSATFATSRAPSLIGQLPNGWPRRLVATMQGIIQDDGSQIANRVSLTNAIVLRIHP